MLGGGDECAVIHNLPLHSASCWNQSQMQIHKHVVEYNVLHMSRMSRHRTRPKRASRKSRNLFSICDYSGQLSSLCVQLASRDGLHQTQAAIHYMQSLLVIKTPVVMMGRHPAGKPPVPYLSWKLTELQSKTVYRNLNVRVER